jgi:hypothetical protein
MRNFAFVLVTTLFVSLSTQAAPPGRMPRADDATKSGEWTVRSLSRSAPEDALVVADCHADANVFCMSYSRVNVGVTWVNPYSGLGGTAGVLPQNDEFAYFYYSDPRNPEVFVKVLGDNNPDFIQLYVGGTTDFEYTVTFSGCGTVVTYHKPPYVFTGTVSASAIPNPSCARGVVWAAQAPVTSLNGLRGDLTLAAGTDLTLTPSGQTLTLAANSASANTFNTLVRRDGSGNFSAGTITASLTGNVTGNVTGAASANVLKAGDTMTGTLVLNPGNINLTPSSASSGSILKNGIRFLHDFGTNNTFVGQSAGNVTMTGTSNTASGSAALLSNTTGGGNTASGHGALQSNTTAFFNTASGIQALYTNTTGGDNTASGAFALVLNTTGNNNTASGSRALYSNTTGAGNTASGAYALTSNTTGVSNTASGYGALYTNTTGGDNTASGYQALYNSTTGGHNTASGSGALVSNTTGSYNTASGYGALGHNITGFYNVASGYAALGSNTTGADNTASGTVALSSNTTGANNTANGSSALTSNTTGGQNTASGYVALQWNTTGNSNTAVGWSAGGYSGGLTGYTGAITTAAITTGSQNTLVGSLAGATNAGVTNCTAVGVETYCDGNNQVRLGNYQVTSIGGKVAWSALSDFRAKKDVRELSLGLGFITALRPVEYRMRKGNERVDMGFVAQDVEALLGDGYNVLDVGGDEDRTLSLRYTDLIAPLVKAVQEQQVTIQAQQAKIESLTAALAELNGLKVAVEELRKQVRSDPN